MNKTEFDWLHDRFSSKRPTLPDIYQKIYEAEYKRNRENRSGYHGLKHKLEGWMHAYVQKLNGSSGAILELGAGTLNHIPFEKQADTYDIVEPFTSLYEGRPELARVRSIYQDINQIAYQNSYGKILSIAVLEHIEDLPCVIAKSTLLLADDGVMAHGIPSEGGALWLSAWKFGTGVGFRLRTGLSYEPLMRHEHINNAAEIIRVLSIFFDEVSISRFPLNFLHGSLYTGICARKPRKKIALEFLGKCY